MTLDDIRARFPGLGLALYAFEPGGVVTLEIHEGGQVYTFKAETETGAIGAAFPELALGVGETETLAPEAPAAPSFFD